MSQCHVAPVGEQWELCKACTKHCPWDEEPQALVTTKPQPALSPCPRGGCEECRFDIETNCPKAWAQ